MVKINSNLLILVGLLILLTSVGCNSWTRAVGGTTNINLIKGHKLISMSWKEADIWVVSRPMRATEEAEVIHYTEYSNLGILQGKVIVTESK